MKNIESFIETPGDKDVKVDQVFTNQMFKDLETRMNAVGWPSVRSYWESDFKDRKIVNGFLKVSHFVVVGNVMNQLISNYSLQCNDICRIRHLEANV